MSQEPKEKAYAFVRYMMERIHQDPRLAYLVGPGSQAFALLTTAYGSIEGQDISALRERLDVDLKFQRVPAIGCEVQTVDIDVANVAFQASQEVLDQIAALEQEVRSLRRWRDTARSYSTVITQRDRLLPALKALHANVIAQDLENEAQRPTEMEFQRCVRDAADAIALVEGQEGGGS